MSTRPLFVGLVLVLAVAGCGSGELSLTEYAGEVETLVAEMELEFTTIDAEWVSQPPSVERAAVYWDQRLDIRHEFLEGIRDLRPPEEVAAMHDRSIELFNRMTDADVALRARVDSMDTINDHWQWVDTPEGRAADAVLADVYAFCRSSQDEFDATSDRETFDDMPWIPSEMKEVVRVAFGCPPSE